MIGKDIDDKATIIILSAISIVIISFIVILLAYYFCYQKSTKKARKKSADRDKARNTSSDKYSMSASPMNKQLNRTEE